MKINYVEGDATEPVGDGAKCIVHCCNDVGAWSAGFVLAISKKWTHVQNAYLIWAGKLTRNQVSNTTKYGATGSFKLGQVQWVGTDTSAFMPNQTWVFNLIGQQDVGIKKVGGVDIPPVCYRAIKEGLARIKAYYMGAVNNKNAFSLHMPRMGCGLAGGKWEHIESILNEVFGDTDIQITVYDWVEN